MTDGTASAKTRAASVSDVVELVLEIQQLHDKKQQYLQRSRELIAQLAAVLHTTQFSLYMVGQDQWSDGQRREFVLCFRTLRRNLRGLRKRYSSKLCKEDLQRHTITSANTRRHREIEESLQRLHSKALHCYAKLPTAPSPSTMHRLIICNGLLQPRLRRLDMIMMRLTIHLGGVVNNNVLDPHFEVIEQEHSKESFWSENETVCGREKLVALKDLWVKQTKRSSYSTFLIAMGMELKSFPAIFVKIVQILAPELQVICVIENGKISCIVVMVSVAPFQSDSWGWVYSTAEVGPHVIRCFDTSFVHTWLLTRGESNDVIAMQQLKQLTSAQLKGFAELAYREGKNVHLSPSDRRSCRDGIRLLARNKGIVPASFYVHNVVLEDAYRMDSGGFGDIYLGTCNNEKVCIKALRRSDPSEHSQATIDVCREALLWMRVKHKNILEFRGVSNSIIPNTHSLISPWMKNGSIMNYLARHPTFDKSEAIMDIATGLKFLHAHESKIVHGDIKGVGDCLDLAAQRFLNLLERKDNVLVKDDGTCCISDFGLSIVTGMDTFHSTTNFHGSLFWMAPELLKSICNKNYATDVYAFGCTVYQIFTKSPPFSKLKYMAPSAVIAGVRPERPLSFAFPDEIWDIIEHCWAQDRELRPNMDQVWYILHDYNSKRPPISTAVNVKPVSKTVVTRKQAANVRRYGVYGKSPDSDLL